MVRQRFSITEYDAPSPLVSEISRATSLPLQRVSDYLLSAGDRAAHVLNFSTNPISVVGNRVQAIDFAGLLRAGPVIELEIVPKFLGGDASGWREDFFFIAMLSRHGRLLSHERLRALSTPNTDLATLLGRALVQMYWDQHRKPIKTYRRVKENDFDLNGEAEGEDLRFPSDDGFPQTVIRFDRSNAFNSAIKHATLALCPLVKDPEARASLQRIGYLLGSQSSVRSVRPKRLPSRSSSWQSTYDLALDVLQDFGLTYEGGRALAPGFLVSTWQVWEDLVTISVRSQLGGRAVASQKGFQLGHRQRHGEANSGNRRAFSVTPDLAVDGSRVGLGKILIDAKYKGRWHQGRQRISEADIYEAMAFARASGAQTVFLVYPKLKTGDAPQTGATAVFERVEIDGLNIWGVEADVRGISKSGGLRRFAGGLIEGLRAPNAGTSGTIAS